MNTFITTAINKHINMSKLHIINDEYITTMAESYASKKHHKAVKTKEGTVISIKWLRVREAYIDACKQTIADIVALSSGNLE